MFGEKFQRKYALTDQGVRNTKKGTFWTVIVNLTVMGGVSILYLVMSGFMGTLTEGSPLPGTARVIGLLVLFVLLSFVTHLQQYKATYGLVSMRSKPHGSVWRNGCANCRWGISASVIWQT